MWTPTRAALPLAALLAACAQTPPAVTEAAPTVQPCPADVPAGAVCRFGTDSAGAHYVIVVPAAWNRKLVLHAHGGPTLGPVKPERALEDLKRWGLWVRMGYAFAASTFRQGGVAVRSAAEDTERLRGIFVQHVARPERTVLHGQSWGAGVAAKGAEMFTAGRPYDAVLLTSGVLAGGTRAYDFRLDLRVVYQALCNNHPRPDEPAYPLWMGLPAGASMTSRQLGERTRDCLGIGVPAAQRTAEQARKLKTIVDVVRIPESSVQSHLNWATGHFQDIVQNRTGGLNPFGNTGARYTGSPDDAALNAAVLRYRADPAAVARFAADTDPEGRIPVPVLTVHAIDDPTAAVEMESTFADTMARGGSGARLVQVFTGHDEHSYLDDPVYVAAIEALTAWADGGARPTPVAIAQRCQALESTWGGGCRMRPDYRPAPLDGRVAPRERP
jgi:poly(3-hydroxybutyrate) depolymerase